MSHHLPRCFTRILLVLLLTLQLGACSSTRLSYQFADRGVVWWVEDYVDLTSEQEDALLADLRTLRDWHCESELPRYSDWLAGLRMETRSGELAPDRIRWHREQAGRFLEPLTDRAVPVAARLLQSLSDDQAQQLVTSMREELAEDRQEYLQDDTPEEAADRVRERAERWLGDLNRSQLTVIRQWVAGRDGATEAWLEGRARWQAAFAELLSERREADFNARLRDMIVNYEQYQGEGYQARAEQSADDIVRLTHQLLVSAEERHWQHLQTETSDLRQDLVAMACTADAGSAAG